MQSVSKLSQLLGLAEESFRVNNFGVAKNALVECLKIAPKNSRVNELLAYICGNEGDLTRAKELLSLACTDPNCSAGALYELGSLHLQSNQPTLAISNFERALLKAGNFFEGLHDLGIALAKTGDLTGAASTLEKAINLNPNSAELLYNTARIYDDLKLSERALEFYKKSINIDRRFVRAWVNQGIIFHDQQKYQESLASYDEALRIDPSFADAWLNKGFCLHSLMMLDEAIESYEKAIAIEPSLAEAHFNKGLTLLLQGKLENGFSEYEWRWKCKEFFHQNRYFSKPQWSGNFDIAGKTILLHNEQGLGDAIQFSRYVKILASKGAKVLLEVEESLFELFCSLECVSQLIVKGKKLPNFDCHSPLMSLPLALKTDIPTIPSLPSYLNAPPLKIQSWEERLGTKSKPRIGIVWSSFSNHKRDKDRSISLSTFIKGFKVDQFDLICLQQKIKSDDEPTLASRHDIRFFGSELKDFSDTAALIECLDLVISVDTSVAHLSGSLGKDAWILLSYCPDWRWLTNINTSPWYPTIRLYRQKRGEDWSMVMSRLSIDLNNFH